jgi:hypothetical protein
MAFKIYEAGCINHSGKFDESGNCILSNKDAFKNGLMVDCAECIKIQKMARQGCPECCEEIGFNNWCIRAGESEFSLWHRDCRVEQQKRLDDFRLYMQFKNDSLALFKAGFTHTTLEAQVLNMLHKGKRELSLKYWERLNTALNFALELAANGINVREG